MTITLNDVYELITKTLLFLLIFGMSATVEMGHLKQQMRNKFAILSGILMQFIIMPFLGFVAVISLSGSGLTPPMGMTLLIVTSSPGGSFSNWFCSMFNADLALSVTMTALSTLLSTFLLPANLILYTFAAYNKSSTVLELEETVLSSVDWLDLFITLMVVILAIVTGLLTSYKLASARFRRIANCLGSLAGLALVGFTFLLGTLTGDDGSHSDDVNGVNDRTRIWNQSWTFYVGVALPCLAGLVLSNVLASIARLSSPERVTISVECCYQNVGIATSAAVSMYQDPTDRAQAICVPLFYGLVEAVVISLYCTAAWKLDWTNAPKTDNFFAMLFNTYEVDSENENPNPDDVKHQNNSQLATLNPRSLSSTPSYSIFDWIHRFFTTILTTTRPCRTCGGTTTDKDKPSHETNAQSDDNTITTSTTDMSTVASGGRRNGAHISSSSDSPSSPSTVILVRSNNKDSSQRDLNLGPIAEDDCEPVIQEDDIELQQCQVGQTLSC